MEELERLNLPELPHIVTEGIVNIPSKQFKEIVNYINTLTKCVNAQSQIIKSLSERMDVCEENTAKIAEIVEELYETL